MKHRIALASVIISLECMAISSCAWASEFTFTGRTLTDPILARQEDKLDEVNSTFYKALEDGRQAVCCQLLVSFPALIGSSDNIGGSSTAGLPMLAVAAVRNCRAVIKAAIEAGADINRRDATHGYSTLQYALNEGANKETIDFLLANNANINTHDRNGDTPLCDAVRNEKIDRVKLLVEKGAEVDCLNNDHNTPLAYAVFLARNASTGIYDNSIVDYLLSKGASANAKGILTATLLHNAVEDSNTEIVRNLLEHGANKNAMNADGVTPLDETTQKVLTAVLRDERTELVHLLSPAEKKQPLQEAIKSGDTGLVLQILRAHPDTINYVDEFSMNPLQVAVMYDRVEIVKLLLARGALPNSTGGTLIFPLIYNAFTGDVNITRILVHAGADTTLGCTADLLGRNATMPLPLSQLNRNPSAHVYTPSEVGIGGASREYLIQIEQKAASEVQEKQNYASAAQLLRVRRAFLSAASKTWPTSKFLGTWVRNDPGVHVNAGSVVRPDIWTVRSSERIEVTLLKNGRAIVIQTVDKNVRATPKIQTVLWWEYQGYVRFAPSMDGAFNMARIARNGQFSLITVSEANRKHASMITQELSGFNKGTSISKKLVIGLSGIPLKLDDLNVLNLTNQ